MEKDIKVIHQLEIDLNIKVEKYNGSFGSCYKLDSNNNVIELYLIDVGITEFPHGILNLQRLKTLSLYNNKINTLPLELSQLKELVSLDIDENPLTRPPVEIASQGLFAILEYLKELYIKEGGKLLNEAKLILLGQGDVGKTCLANRLIYNKFIIDETTRGINILKWITNKKLKDEDRLILNLWDFGGQEIYHATHQFFLTQRSIYLIVWNARKSLDYEHIFKWLYVSETYGKDSPVILVLTKKNERDDDLNIRDLKIRFPQLVNLIKVDSQDGTGFYELKETIKSVAVQLPQMKEVWIKSWLKVRKILEKKSENWISFDTFLKICHENRISENQASILSEYLHNLGVILHFKNNLILKNIIVLKPKWATNAVYKIIDSEYVIGNNGILQNSQIDCIWEDSILYPNSVYPMLIELMNSFELAYKLPDENSYLVAERLPKNTPYIEWDSNNNLLFFYRYDFLPEGILPRFIVRINNEIECDDRDNQICWREGVVINRDKTRAYVKLNREQKVIEIAIIGERKRELLAIIRREFDIINKTFRNLKITQEIPCNCDINCPQRHDYHKLLVGEFKDVKTFYCDVSWKQVSIPTLLDGYEKMETRKEEGNIYNIVKDKEWRVNISEKVQEKIIYVEKTSGSNYKKEKSSLGFLSTIWKIIAGFAVVLGIVYTTIRLYAFITSNTKSNNVEEKAQPTKGNIDTLNLVKDSINKIVDE